MQTVALTTMEVKVEMDTAKGTPNEPKAVKGGVVVRDVKKRAASIATPRVVLEDTLLTDMGVEVVHRWTIELIILKITMVVAMAMAADMIVVVMDMVLETDMGNMGMGMVLVTDMEILVVGEVEVAVLHAGNGVDAWTTIVPMIDTVKVVEEVAVMIACGIVTEGVQVDETRMDALPDGLDHAASAGRAVAVETVVEVIVGAGAGIEIDRPSRRAGAGIEIDRPSPSRRAGVTADPQVEAGTGIEIGIEAVRDHVPMMTFRVALEVRVDLEV